MESMKFEWDEKKNETNKTKHGLDFVDATPLFDSPGAVIMQANTIDDEVRFMLIADSDGKLYSVLYTERDTATIRIISFRRSNAKEEKFYAWTEKNNNR